MIVRCANCHTEFSLDDRQVGPEGATVRCSVCAYVFRVDSPEGGTGEQPWQIRTVEDLLFTAPDLATLQQWIEEGRLHPEDQVSRTGKHWLRLGDMPEFSRAFQGFQGLPQVVTPAAEEPPPAAAADLGPPPAYGEGSGPSEEKQASSMLDAVTRHVQSGGVASEREPSFQPSAPPDAHVASSGASTSMGDVGQSMEQFVARSSGRGWLWATLGIAAGVAIVFLVPPVRQSVLGVAEGIVGKPAESGAVDIPELDAARQAFQRLDPAAVGRAEATLQAAIDEGGTSAAAVASMKLYQVELLSARSLEYQLLTALEADDEAAKRQADEYADRAARIFDEVDVGQVTDREHLRRVRALLRLVEGRSVDEIMALVPSDGAEELRGWVKAAPLWRRPDAEIPADVIGSLRSLDQPAMLSRLVLALAYHRAGDFDGAKAVVERILGEVPRQPTALALKGALERDAEPSDGGTGGEATATGTEQRPEVEDARASQEPERDDDDRDRRGRKRDDGPTVDQLIERGCSGIESGHVASGMELLARARRKRPKDLDVLVCMAEGNIKRGKRSAALALYERALQRSPRYRLALVGAAETAARLGRTSKAVQYYRRLLKLDPGNGKAKAYVQQHGSNAG